MECGLHQPRCPSALLLLVEVLGGTRAGGQWETCSVSHVLSVEAVKVSQGWVAGEEAGIFTGMRPAEAELLLWSVKHLGSQGALWLWEREES